MSSTGSHNGPHMFRTVCVGLALLVPAGAGAQGYRPLSLADMVKAVGTGSEGMPPEELPKRITTYAYYMTDDAGVGVAVRFAEDPTGAILAGWRSRGELWRYAWIEDPTLGRLEAFRPAGPGFIIDTRHSDGTATTAVLRRDLTVLATVSGIVRLAFTSGALVLLQGRGVALFDPASNHTTTIFTPAEAAASPAFSAFAHDPKTDSLTFELRAGGTVTPVRCTGVSGVQRKCS